MAWNNGIGRNRVGDGYVGQAPEQQQAGQLGMWLAGRELRISTAKDRASLHCLPAHPMCMKA